MDPSWLYVVLLVPLFIVWIILLIANNKRSHGDRVPEDKDGGWG